MQQCSHANQSEMSESRASFASMSTAAAQDWEHPPFSGAVADGYIWGRGTLDVKSGAIGLLEAATALLHEGAAACLQSR